MRIGEKSEWIEWTADEPYRNEYLNSKPGRAEFGESEE